MSLSDEDFVRHVLDEACNIAAFMKDKSIEDLRSNIMLDRAVTRSLEIMGEASKKVSKEYQKKTSISTLARNVGHPKPYHPFLFRHRSRSNHGYCHQRITHPD